MGPVIYSLVLSCLRNLYHHLLISLTLLIVVTHLISLHSSLCTIAHMVYAHTSYHSIVPYFTVYLHSNCANTNALPDISRRHPMHQRAHLFATCYVSLFIHARCTAFHTAYNIPFTLPRPLGTSNDEEQILSVR